VSKKAKIDKKIAERKLDRLTVKLCDQQKRVDCLEPANKEAACLELNASLTIASDLCKTRPTSPD
jgi:hypothetical protein